MYNTSPLLMITLIAGLAFGHGSRVPAPEPPTPEALQQYEALELPTLPGLPYPRARAINNSGHVVGTNYACPFILSCLSRAFFFDGQHLRDISAQAVAAVPEGFVGLPSAMDLNHADQAVIRMAVPDLGVYHYLWDNGDTVLIRADPDPENPGPLVPIPPPPVTAWSANDNGTVVGTVAVGDPGSAVDHVFLWERGRGFVQLIGAPLGYDGIGARGVNNLGHVVGGLATGSEQQGYIWIDGEFTLLPPLAGDTASAALAVNDAGDVVGTSKGPGGLDSLVIWRDGQIVDFVTLDFQPVLLQFPESINAGSAVAGYYWPTAEAFQHFGFVWTQRDGFLTLSGAIQNIPELSIWAAEGVNDAGQLAVWGDYPDFTGAAFILTPINSGIPGDLDGDGIVGSADLSLLLGSWGACAGCPADLNDDGLVNAADLALLLANWS